MPAGGLKRMAAEFPEMAKFLQEDLAEVLGQIGGAPAAPTSEDLGALLAPRFEETLSEVDMRVEKRLLKRDHPDWEKVVKLPEFADWKSKVLPPEQAAELDDSWDADVIGTRLSEFKSWRATKEQKQAARREQLEDAITPASGRRDKSGSVPLDEEEAFLAGFAGL